MRKRWLRLAALPVALALVAVACGDDDDDDAGSGGHVSAEGTTADEGTTAEDTAAEGTTAEGTAAEGTTAEGDGATDDFGGAEVTITGSERDDPSVIAINTALAEFGEANGIEITFTGDADWEANINTQVEGGNPPNIGIFPQPGKLADFASQEFIVPLSDEVVSAVETNWDADYYNYAVVDDVLYGVPVKTDLKSLVWYKPAVFEAAGFAVPETFEEFTALIDADEGRGRRPQAALRRHRVGQRHRLDRTRTGSRRWCCACTAATSTTSGSATRSRSTIRRSSRRCSRCSTCGPRRTCSPAAATSPPPTSATTPRRSSTTSATCTARRRSSAASSLTGRRSPTGPRAPSTSSTSRTSTVTARSSRPARTPLPSTTTRPRWRSSPTCRSPEYANLRQATQTAELDGGLSGFLSAVKGGDPSVYQPLEQGFLEILNSSELSRFDGSDLMPADVGAGAFWTEGTAAVNGDQDAAAAAANIDGSWPS